MKTNFSPYYLIYNREVILLLDIILRSDQIYYHNENHEIAPQEMNHTFTLVRSKIKKARRREMK